MGMNSEQLRSMRRFISLRRIGDLFIGRAVEELDDRDGGIVTILVAAEAIMIDSEGVVRHVEASPIINNGHIRICRLGDGGERLRRLRGR